jgi:flagellar biosynthesis protein FlhB
MSAIPKMIAGIIVFLVGIYWYLPTSWFKQFVPITVGSTFQAFLVVFFGLFGLALILLGILVAWIEFEDMRWERREKKDKQEQAKQEAAKPQPAPKPKKK